MSVRFSATEVQAEQTPKTIIASMSPYTVLGTDEVLAIDTAAGAIELLLPSAAATPFGKRLLILDHTGNFGRDGCTLTPNGSDKIGGVSSRVMTIPGEVAQLLCNGVNGWANTDGQSAIDVLAGQVTAQENFLAAVVITAAGGTGGSTAGTISVQVTDRTGTPIGRLVHLRLDISDTQYAGSLDPATTCQFGAASTGTILVGTGAASAIVQTDATGLYEGALSNAADETNYISASKSDGGDPSSSSGILIVDHVPASATWSA
jgi:hypothetical protein